MLGQTHHRRQSAGGPAESAQSMPSRRRHDSAAGLGRGVERFLKCRRIIGLAIALRTEVADQVRIRISGDTLGRENQAEQN